MRHAGVPSFIDAECKRIPSAKPQGIERKARNQTLRNSFFWALNSEEKKTKWIASQTKNKKSSQTFQDLGEDRRVRKFHKKTMLTKKSAPKSEFRNAIVPGNGQIAIKVHPKNITRYGIKLEKEKKEG